MHKFIVLLFPLISFAQVPPQHGIAMHGDLKYDAQFTHFDYTNPAALKGGKLKLAALGSFDSLNPFILKGQKANGIYAIYDTLMVPSLDEPFSKYGLIAESIEIPEDRRWVIFNLRPQARFHDGSKLTADDVLFSFNALKTKGHPIYKIFYKDILKVEKLTDYRVKFLFAPVANRELPLIIGGLHILPKAYWEKHDFAKTTLQPPLGGGPYKIAKVVAGRTIRYERVKHYWAKDLPVRKGQFNYDTKQYDYYRDSTVAMEAFKAGSYDIRLENVSKIWATGYNFPAINKGDVLRKEIKNESSSGMQAFVLNNRLEIFKDIRVRQALTLLFDFEWTNKNLFYSAYHRTESYFSNSELASSGIPSGDELALLEPFRWQLPKALFKHPFSLLKTKGDGNIRNNLRRALGLFKQAGWSVKNGKLMHHNTRTPMKFEILLVLPAFERIVLPYKRNLNRLGIEVNVRTVDSAQYIRRIKKFEFDVIVSTFGQSLSPGNEQRGYWHSDNVNVVGSNNLAGIKNPVIDALISNVIKAQKRNELVTASQALDRVLLWHYYMIPHWHIEVTRVAYWNKFGFPKIFPKYALSEDTLWVIPEKEKQMQIAQGQ